MFQTFRSVCLCSDLHRGTTVVLWCVMVTQGSCRWASPAPVVVVFQVRLVSTPKCPGIWPSSTTTSPRDERIAADSGAVQTLLLANVLMTSRRVTVFAFNSFWESVSENLFISWSIYLKAQFRVFHLFWIKFTKQRSSQCASWYATTQWLAILPYSKNITDWSHRCNWWSHWRHVHAQVNTGVNVSVNGRLFPYLTLAAVTWPWNAEWVV